MKSPTRHVDRGDRFGMLKATPRNRAFAAALSRAPRRDRLFRGCSRGLDKPRHPLVAAPQTLAVHRLELGCREGVRRIPLEKRFHPCLQPRESFDMAELLDPVE